MSRVYIKGFKMPETCIYCPMCHFGEQGAWDSCNYMYHKHHTREGYCFDVLEQEIRPRWCPLEGVNKR